MTTQPPPQSSEPAPVCTYELYLGKCGQPASDGDRCPEHAALVCINCGKRAVIACDYEGQFEIVCGWPLCAGCVHDEKMGGHKAKSPAPVATDTQAREADAIEHCDLWTARNPDAHEVLNLSHGWSSKRGLSFREALVRYPEAAREALRRMRAVAASYLEEMRKLVESDDFSELNHHAGHVCSEMNAIERLIKAHWANMRGEPEGQEPATSAPAGDAEEQLFAAISALSDEARASLLSRFWSPAEIRAVEARAGELHRALNGDAEVSQCPGCTSGRAERCELRDGHFEVSHEEARAEVKMMFGYAAKPAELYRYISQQEARQRQAESSLNACAESLAKEIHAKCDQRDRAERAEREVVELQAGYPDACDKFQSQLRSIAAQRDELSRKLEAAERDREDYRIGARAEAERCNQLLAERNRARNETIAALEKLEAAERDARRLRSAIAEGVAQLEETKWNPVGDIAEWAATTGDGANHGRVMQALDALRGLETPPAKPLTPDDVRAIAREVIAEVAERAASRTGFGSLTLYVVAEAAKEESNA